jgi:fermentation-respiration switch protein FrsA (DUF1100 family)
MAKTVKPGTQILHSRADDVVPFSDSVELISMSHLPKTALIEVGQDHRLADIEPLEALLRAVEAGCPLVNKPRSNDEIAGGK